ncbi:transglutaminase domain-containing protein [Nocardioides humilatus]|uniref:Transglutaminase domain-containing protein n=1 Tax=Nocardioides humilatus TaxID=2607660 RepID=A0A5B1LM44_9ACTN|nr:transglutaminase-like domain-containing protein [Nocardioides humilatus]KAA1421546.1 transglutaminase domain-containing protein [Nocardioides humilatus]
MTAAPVTGTGLPQATSGSTTRRAGFWQSPTVRRGAVDLACVALLLSTGVLAFGPVFGGSVGYVAAAGGAVAGLGLALVSTWRGWTRLGTLLATILVYLALGGALALPDTTVGGILPRLETIRRLTLLSWQSWRDLLTVPLPAGDFDGPAVLPFLAALLCSTLAGCAVLRLRRLGLTVALGISPAATLLVVGILWGSHSAPAAAGQGAVFVVAALAWTSWRSQLGAIDTHVVFLRSASTPRSARTHQAVSAGLALALAAGFGVGAWLVVAPSPDRHVLRDEVDPPFDPQQYASPLTMYRYLESELDDDVLFTVSGLPAGARVRLAAMDVYDGNVYNVSEDSAEFARVGTSVEPSRYSDPAADVTELSFHIGAYEGVWIPGGGDLRGLAVPDTLGTVYYNDATGTALATNGLGDGDEYALDVALAPSYTPEELDDLPSDAQPDATFPIAVNTATVEAVGAALPDLAGDKATPMDQLRAIRSALSTDGRFADGEPFPSLPGHTNGRITRLLADDSGQMVGDDEQYAVAMTLMARDLGWPARVVMGFYPDPTAGSGDEVAITGDDAHVWTEVRFEGLGWVPFDPTPDDDNKPNVQQPEPQDRKDPQVLPPPDIPDDRDAKAPPPADSDIDKDEDGAGTVWRFLKLAVITAGTIAILVSPFLLIAALKNRRRRKRRTTGDLADRISGGWAEVMDLATDIGAKVPAPATRFESAVMLEDRMPLATTLSIAHRVDGHVFGAGDPTEVDVEAVWSAVENLRSEFRESASFRDRIRQRFSLRSLVRRPEWLARAELRATSGGSR